MNKKTIFVVASGSGGHIIPALELGKKWKKNNPDGKVIFFCSKKKLDKKIIIENNFLKKVVFFKLDKFPGKRLFSYPKFACQLFFISLKSIFYLFRFSPSKVISTGGYTSIPLCMLSKLFKTKVHLYELNTTPGRAISFLQNVANKIFVLFEETKNKFSRKNLEKIELSKYPIRFTEKDKIFDKIELIKEINQNHQTNFELNRKTLFLLGGSQGSIFLNNLLKKFIEKKEIELNKIQVIHQTGSLDKTDWKTFYKNLNIPALIFSFQPDIKNYYLLSDFVISRAGAGTLFELEFFRKKSLIIPLKTRSTDHQMDNILTMTKKNPDLFIFKDQDSKFENINFLK